MEIFKSLIGNEDIKNTLGKAIANKEFLHAYIIEGAYGTGKHTVARLASMGIMCKNNCTSKSKCHICTKIENGNCADVRFFDAFKVDDIRKIKETLYESPTECDYKIYVLCNAEKMNVKAQNALLISLEEPPKNVIFFLLCTDASVLLETIRSRAQILRTKPLSKEQIKEYLKDVDAPLPSDEALDEIILSSFGSLGYVLDMLDKEKSSVLIKERERAKELSHAILDNNQSTVTLLSSMFNMTREKLKELLALTMLSLRDLAVIKRAKDAPLCFYTVRSEVVSLASKYPLQRIIYTYSKVEEAISALNANANVPNTLISIITDSKKKGN